MAVGNRSGIRIHGLNDLITNLGLLGGPIVKRAARDALWKAGAHLEEKLKTRLSEPGTGHTYLRKGIKTRRYAFHRASEPGSPPAPDTGRLRSSITHNVTGRPGRRLPDPGGSAVYARANIGTNVPYGYHLERGFRSRPYGNPRLAPVFVQPRPWFFVTLEIERLTVARIIRTSLSASLEGARLVRSFRRRR